MKLAVPAWYTQERTRALLSIDPLQLHDARKRGCFGWLYRDRDARGFPLPTFCRVLDCPIRTQCGELYEATMRLADEQVARERLSDVPPESMAAYMTGRRQRTMARRARMYKRKVARRVYDVTSDDLAARLARAWLLGLGAPPVLTLTPFHRLADAAPIRERCGDILVTVRHSYHALYRYHETPESYRCDARLVTRMCSDGVRCELADEAAQCLATDPLGAWPVMPDPSATQHYKHRVFIASPVEAQALGKRLADALGKRETPAWGLRWRDGRTDLYAEPPDMRTEESKTP
jgi:hypothetical protein